MLKIIRSGGQTGPDRAALDAAILNNIAYTGYVPKNGWAEDYPYSPGLLEDYENLIETEDPNPGTRTLLNVAESDATLIILGNSGTESYGTDVTVEACRRINKPYMTAYDVHHAEQIIHWIIGYNISDLNIAGPRESESPGIQDRARGIIEAVIRNLAINGHVETIE